MTTPTHHSALAPDQQSPASTFLNALECQHALLQIEELAGFGEISNERLMTWLHSYITTARKLAPYPPELQRIDDAVRALNAAHGQKELVFSSGGGSDDPIVTGFEKQT